MSGPELELWFKGKNKIADYLANNTIREADTYAKNLPWTRIIWDVTAIAWLLNDGDRFMNSCIMPMNIPEYNHQYVALPEGHSMRYVYFIHRDSLIRDLINKITSRK